jgi:hypothetical protein|tara:strand:- start:1025 stop:1240 length:216 start_codon:yes stop_codon:yes gene_type:complete
LRKIVDGEKHFMLFKKIDNKIVIEKDYEHYPDNPYSLDEGKKIYFDCKSDGWEPLDEYGKSWDEAFSETLL